MSEEIIVDSKEFKIRNLVRMVVERDEEIVRLNKILDNVKYFNLLSYERIQKAVDGELEKPILRSLD